MAPCTTTERWERYIVRAARVPEETRVTVIGRASEITTGFTSAIEAERWHWDEVAHVDALCALPPSTRSLIALPVSAFDITTYTTIGRVTSALALPLVVFSRAHHPAVVRTILQAGADDFLPLPVTVEEMIARLTAVIRVRYGAQDEVYRSDYFLDDAAQTVAIVGADTIRLSVSEYRLFRMLFAARNRPVARERLTAVPLPHAEADGQNALDATVSRLRRKLGAERIVTIRSIGYQLVDNRQLPDNVSYMRGRSNE